MVLKNLRSQKNRGTQLAYWQGRLSRTGRRVKSWSQNWTDARRDCSLPRTLALSGATVSLMLAIAQLGFFQNGEVKAFDLLTQLSAQLEDQLESQRLFSASQNPVVIVEITEEDIQQQKQWPLSDQVFASVLAELQIHSPQVIGLDIYRDLPYEPGTQALAKQLQRKNVVTITKLDSVGATEVPSPLQVPEQRTGFSDLVVDPDGVIRRNFMFAVLEDEQQLYSFALRVVERYLERHGLAVFPDGNALQVGKARIEGLSSNTGGYQTIDASGYQTLMRYFWPGRYSTQLSLTQVLAGDFNPNQIEGKIVLIGTTAPSQKDLYYTPFSSTKTDNLLSPGVMVHAQMTHQLVSAALGERSLFGAWFQWGEFVWVGLWGLAGGLIAWRFSHPGTIAIAATTALVVLSTATAILFAQAVWVPYVLPAVTFGITGAALIVYKEFRKTFYDSITGLPNRTLITKALEKTLKKSSQQTTAVILLDIDNFKLFNESFGLKVGDCLLRIVAKRLRQRLPASAKVARIAGDEFVVLLENVTPSEEALKVARTLSQHMAQPIELDSQCPHSLSANQATGQIARQKIFPTVSIGISYSSAATLEDTDALQVVNAESLLRDAQTAMSRAKDNGSRGQCEVFVADMRTRLSNRIWIESDLREAIRHGEFELYYQPLVCLKTMAVAGFEALIRWHHPKRGMISPAEFIPIAEDTGLIIPIGQWVLEEACLQAQRWREQVGENSFLAPPFMSVNLSGRQFAQPDLVEQIDRILRETGLDPSALKLELTESVVMDKVEDSIDVLLRLKALHLKLGIDDFGTGYSSLSYLHRFPIDTLKVDRSFVIEMESPDGTAELVKTIVALGHNLGMNIVAEGIETQSQSEILRALLCEYGQGYLYAKPLPATDAEALLLNPSCWMKG